MLWGQRTEYSTRSCRPRLRLVVEDQLSPLSQATLWQGLQPAKIMGHVRTGWGVRIRVISPCLFGSCPSPVFISEDPSILSTRGTAKIIYMGPPPFPLLYRHLFVNSFRNAHSRPETALNPGDAALVEIHGHCPCPRGDNTVVGKAGWS